MNIKLNLSLLTLSTISFSSAIQPQTLLTVYTALKAPSQERIKRSLESRGGTYTAEIGQEIKMLIQNMLRGTATAHNREYNNDREIKPTESHTINTVKAITGLLAKAPFTKLSRLAIKRIQTFLPSLSYVSMMKGIVNACQTVHSSISLQKEHIHAEDEALTSSAVLRTAHYFALDAIIRLLFIMYSPKTHCCERMYALYVLNTVHLMGTQGLVLKRFRARNNRFYFTQSGTLRSYDPSRENNRNEKRIKSLDRFLKVVHTSKGQYLHYLNKGILHGITALSAYHQKESQKKWRSTTRTFMWRYAAGLFKEITSIDVIKIRTVDPERIFSHKGNKDFLHVMILSDLNNSKTISWHSSRDKAQKLINSHKNARSPGSSTLSRIMQRYYLESYKRFSDKNIYPKQELTADINNKKENSPELPVKIAMPS